MNDTFLWQKAEKFSKMNEVMSTGNKTQLKKSPVVKSWKCEYFSTNDGNGLY